MLPTGTWRSDFAEFVVYDSVLLGRGDIRTIISTEDGQDGNPNTDNGNAQRGHGGECYHGGRGGECSRRWLLIINDSDEAIYVKLGAAAVLNQGIRINSAGGSLELVGASLYTGAVNGICASGGKIALVTEGV